MDSRLKARAGPDGLHFFDRQTGTNILLDEVSVAAEDWSKAPRQVSIALTNACELECPFCYAPKHSARLLEEDVKRWLLELDSAGCLFVGFGGGEPTLFPGFASLCRFAKESTRLAISFTTHGHRMTPVLAESLKGNVHFIRVSMDGVAHSYELHRGRSFKTFLDKLAIIKSIGPFGINYVVNSITINEIDAAIEVASKVGASEFMLLPERRTSSTDGIDEQSRHALRKWIRNYGRKVRLAVSDSDADGLPVCRPLPLEIGLRTYAHIAADGVLKRSSYDQDGAKIEQHGVLHAMKLLDAGKM